MIKFVDRVTFRIEGMRGAVLVLDRSLDFFVSMSVGCTLR